MVQHDKTDINRFPARAVRRQSRPCVYRNSANIVTSLTHTTWQGGAGQNLCQMTLTAATFQCRCRVDLYGLWPGAYVSAGRSRCLRCSVKPIKLLLLFDISRASNRRSFPSVTADNRTDEGLNQAVEVDFKTLFKKNLENSKVRVLGVFESFFSLTV